MTIVLRQKPLPQVVRQIVQRDNGAWFDPSDLSTLYQDAAGTTPVTAVEQPVGLMLDKSRGMMLGTELVSNGTFDTDTKWTKQTGWSISTGSARCDGSQVSTSLLYQDVLKLGKCYRIEFDVVITAGNMSVRTGATGADSTVTTSGRKTQTSFCVGNTVLQIRANVGFVGSIDNISVRELYGHHATQSVTASRPALSARYNLFTGTDTFSGWNTSNTTIVDGLLTAKSTYTEGYLRCQTAQLINTKYSTSIEAKRGTTKWLRLRNLAVNNNVNGEAWFDLSSGVLGTVLGSVSASIVDVGGGYFRCSITGSTISTINANYVDYAPSDADNTRSATVGKTLYVRNPIHNIGDLFLPYQRVNTATDYDTDERYFPKYLKLDAVDDHLNLPFMNLYNGGAASIICARDVVSQSNDTYIISERSTTDADPKYFPSRQLASGGNMDAYISDDNATVVLDTVGSPFSGVANAVILSIVDSGNNLKLFKNGVLAANDNYTRSGTLTLNNTTISASISTTTSNYASMKLYGLIITKSALTDAQRIACEQHLSRKAGVIL